VGPGTGLGVVDKRNIRESNPDSSVVQPIAEPVYRLRYSEFMLCVHFSAFHIHVSDAFHIK
jgi:hypothetical protein